MQTGRNHVFENAAKLNFFNLLRREAKTYLGVFGSPLVRMPDGEPSAYEMVLLALQVQEPNIVKRIRHMKKFVCLLIATAAMVATAYAGEASGAVKSFDAASKTITLEDGAAYVLADGVAADGIVAGAKVKVTFDDASKAATAVAVEK